MTTYEKNVGQTFGARHFFRTFASISHHSLFSIPMSRPTLSRLFLSALLLLSLLSGCGEIEVPMKEDEHPQEVVPGDTGQKEDDTGRDKDDSGNTDDPDNSDDAEGKDEGEITIDPEVPDDAEVTEEQYVGEACFTADGHVLISDRLYLSIYNIKGVVSAYHAESPTAAAEAAASYQEGNLKAGWRVPTEEEARFLIGIYSSSTSIYGDEPLPVLNRVLNARGYDAIIFDPDQRYLCADGQKSFSFQQGTRISKAGTKKEYCLRLVHDK